MNFYKLINRKISGDDLSPEERSFIASHQGRESDKQYESEMEAIWESSADFTPYSDINIEAGLSSLRAKMGGNNENETILTNSKVKVFTMRRMAAAAAVALVILSVVFLYKGEDPMQLAYETNENETMSIELADGSQVILKEQSKLLLENSFSSEDRNLKLEGSAFFDVVKNPELPFSISTDAATVEVLGTSFSVEEAQEGHTLVKVLTGKVKFTDNSTGQEIILTPESVNFADLADDGISAVQEQFGNDLSWATGILDFNETPMKDVIRDISTHYDIELSIESEKVLDCSFTSKLNRVSMEETLKTLGRAFNMTMESKGKTRFLFKGGSCR